MRCRNGEKDRQNKKEKEQVPWGSKLYLRRMFWGKNDEEFKRGSLEATVEPLAKRFLSKYGKPPNRN